MADEKRGMTVQEAGRLGGQKVALRGRAHFEKIGRMGGEAIRNERGVEYYRQIGQRGGKAALAARGKAFYRAIGTKGGQRVRELIEQAKRLAKTEP